MSAILKKHKVTALLISGAGVTLKSVPEALLG
jgi:hypothetical protein